MTNKELHPVRFTREQVNFIRHMMSEKGYEFWEGECDDLSDTISTYSVCPTCNGTGIGKCVDDPCPDCVEQGKCPMCLFPLTEKSPHGRYGKPMPVDAFNRMVEAGGTCPVCYQAFNELEKYGQFPVTQSPDARSTIRDFILWLQDVKDCDICANDHDSPIVPEYFPVASTEDLIDEYIKE
jgi:hypothetical protein